MGIITAEERKMIDEAIAAGRVVKCKPGASALAEEYIYRNGSLVPIDPKFSWKQQSVLSARAKKASRAAHKRTQTGETELRRRKVAKMHAEGKTNNEIIAVLKCERLILQADLRALGLKSNIAK